MLVNPGRSIYTANQQGQTLPIGEPEKDVMSGELLHVAAHRRPPARAGRAPAQRQLAVDLQEPGADRPGATNGWARAAHRRRYRRGGRRGRRRHGGPRRACGRWPGSPRPPNGWRAPTICAHPGVRQRRTRPAHRGVQHDAAGAGRIARAPGPAGHRRGPRAAHPADVVAHQRRTADGVDGTRARRGCPRARWPNCAPT